MLEDLPKVCDTGVKRNAKGYQESWTGYKLHIDAIDGGIPVSCLLTSASVHDSQAAIPALEPESGPEGTEVVVRGENFGPSIGAVQGTSGMSFDGVWGAPAYWSEAEIRVAGRAHREKSSCWGAPYLSESGPEQCGISLYPSS